MQKITPCLWFDGKAEEAAKFYTSIFKKSRIKAIARYGDAGAAASGIPKGTAMTVSFQIFGQDFLGLNGGPLFKFSPAISFIVNCKTQKEVDEYWEKLSKGGKKNRCGWLDDKFGVSWQIVPTILGELMKSKDSKKAERVMQALPKMDKLNIKELKAAYANK